jgi:nanoRNase/pAp phosphatase (c-di-AMP/oligoRNAs hydrolase)
MSLNYPMTARVATALAFGIRTDTLGFTRHFNPVDIRALSWLNAYVDSELIRSIEEPPRSQDTLESFAEALSSRTLVGSTLLAPLSSMPNRDSLAQIADFLLPTEGIDTVVVFGPRRGKVILSARSKDEGIHLGRLLSDTWGGGLSGGQIPFEVLLNQLPENPEEADVQAVDAMSFRLRELFAGGADE